MKLNRIILSLFFVLMPIVASADMTDQQIFQYVAEQSAMGTSQADMLQYLLKNGVSPQRLQKLKDKYQKMQGKGNKSLSGSSSESDRSRTASAGSQVGAAQSGTSFSTDSIRASHLNSASRSQVFGRDMFRNANIRFEPNMNIATPSDYVLGAGDMVFIDVYGASQMSIDGTISPDGFIVVDEYGPLQLAGLTVEQANRRAKSLLGSRFADSTIKLTVGQTRTIHINVVGEVVAPGTYTLSAFSTVFHALYCAGGVSEIGSLRNVKLYRANRLMATVDVYDYILNGKISGDIRLQDNDAIVVSPYDILVNISGNAKRPMSYEMTKEESIAKALEYAGGFSSDAYTKSMRLIRKSGGKMQVLNVSESNMESILVANGDSLFIDGILDRFENMVELKGAVFRPGLYQLDSQTKSIKKLIEYADGVTESAFTSHAVLQRMCKNRQQEIISVDLEGIMKGSVADIELQNEDVLFVPDNKEAQESQTLTIRGEVYEPGIYDFSLNMSVEDLILQAGGMKESALKNKVTIARRNPDGHVENKVIDLNEGLAVDGKKRFILQPFDEVMVTRSEGYMEHRTVTIEGEVYIQGDFSLPKEITRISDILQMAGGLTQKAAANGVYVLRPMEEEEKLLLVKVDQELQDNYFRIAVDLPKVLNKPGCKEDLVLRDGDRIIVQEHKNIVTVVGVVPYKSSVPYVEGKTQRYYLRQGGIRPTRRNRAMSYVVGPNGQASSYRRFKKIEPGSEICLRETTEELTTSQRISIIATVLSSFATAAAVVISVLK